VLAVKGFVVLEKVFTQTTRNPKTMHFSKLAGKNTGSEQNGLSTKRERTISIGVHY
jgi:hypothetical protein